MKAVEIKKGIYWVGAIDWDLRDFHGYLTQRGSTYNAYLIIDEKITLVDTVKSSMTCELIKRISSIVDPSKIDYIVVNHVEMDHSGALPEIMKLAPNAKIITSPNGSRGLEAHYRANWDYQIVKSGDSVNIGSRNIDFILTPMVHWPDNMVAYIPEEKILFSNDGFGQHLASSERFDDEYPVETIFAEAKKYYANIVLPYGVQVQGVLKAVEGLNIEIIASSHGIIWRKHIDKIIEGYKAWSSNEVEKKVVIVYDSMWGSTKVMADAIYGAFESKGYKIVKKNLQKEHMSDIMTDIITAEYICVGSPTLNNNLLPGVAGFLSYLRGLAPKKRKAIAFGSFGWGGQSIDQVAEVLESSGFEVIEKIKQKYIPSEEDLDNIKKIIEEKI